jgi:hypothetical protein
VLGAVGATAGVIWIGYLPSVVSCC